MSNTDMNAEQSNPMFSLQAIMAKVQHVAKLSDQVSVRIDPEWRETLRAIEDKHRIPPPEFIRGLVSAGLEFYRENGWFAFPVIVQPGEAYVQAVAETQSRYHAPANSDKPLPAHTSPIGQKTP